MVANDKTHAIFRNLTEEIIAGKYAVGSRLPTDRELAERFCTSRINVFRALEQLKQLGIICSRKRAGTVVIAIPDAELSQQLLNDSSREVYVLKSRNPNHIHWNENTCRALEKRLARSGFRVQYIPLAGKREVLQEIVTNSMRSGVAGLVILPDSDDSSFLDLNSDLLVDVSTPVFMLNRGNDVSRLDFVNSVNIDVMGDAIRMAVILRKNGFKRMLVPGAEYFSEGNHWSRTRLAGLQLGFRGEGISLPETLPGNEYEAEICLDRALKDPDLILAAIHPLFAKKVIEAAKKRNMTGGKDFNLISFDDNPAFAEYDLTTTAVRRTEIGEIIGNLLVKTSRHPENTVWNSVRVASRIIQRSSCRHLII